MNEKKNCPQCGAEMSWGRNTGFVCVANHDMNKPLKPVDLESARLWLSHNGQDKMTVELGKRLIDEVESLRERVKELEGIVKHRGDSLESMGVFDEHG